MPIGINTDEEPNPHGAEANRAREEVESVEGARDTIFDPEQIPISSPSLTERDVGYSDGLPKVGARGADLTIGPNGGFEENIDDLDSLLRGFS